jgi:predicted short-subunit dehydrogenase-like oxidoreductase (DUF2520 family)
MEPIAIVGAGAVAQALGRMLHARGQKVAALADRTPERAERAAAFIDPSVRVAELAELPRLASRILVAVADQGIGPVAAALAPAMKSVNKGVVLHTSGGAGTDVLRPLNDVGAGCGVWHPLQTITTPEQGLERLVGVTFGISGDPMAVECASELTRRLEGQVLEIDAERLGAYHAGAVMASNALIGVIDAAIALMVHAGVDRREALYAIGPLAFTTVENALTLGPGTALTGPIVRGDVDTVAAHLDAMRGLPAHVVKLYDAAARQLLALATQRGLPAASARAIEAALGDVETSG